MKNLNRIIIGALLLIILALWVSSKDPYHHFQQYQSLTIIDTLAPYRLESLDWSGKTYSQGGGRYDSQRGVFYRQGPVIYFDTTGKEIDTLFYVDGEEFDSPEDFFWQRPTHRQVVPIECDSLPYKIITKHRQRVFSGGELTHELGFDESRGAIYEKHYHKGVLTRSATFSNTSAGIKEEIEHHVESLTPYLTYGVTNHITIWLPSVVMDTTVSVVSPTVVPYQPDQLLGHGTSPSISGLLTYAYTPSVGTRVGIPFIYSYTSHRSDEKPQFPARNISLLEFEVVSPGNYHIFDIIKSLGAATETATFWPIKTWSYSGEPQINTISKWSCDWGTFSYESLADSVQGTFAWNGATAPTKINYDPPRVHFFALLKDSITTVGISGEANTEKEANPITHYTLQVHTPRQEMVVHHAKSWFGIPNNLGDFDHNGQPDLLIISPFNESESLFQVQILDLLSGVIDPQHSVILHHERDKFFTLVSHTWSVPFTFTHHLAFP